MWPFRRRELPAETDRLGTISRRLDDVESKVRTMQGEWHDTLDRLDRQVGRLVKRQARALATEEPSEPAEPTRQTTLDIVALRRSRAARPGGG
jgi:hypothetical protein